MKDFTKEVEGLITWIFEIKPFPVTVKHGLRDHLENAYKSGQRNGRREEKKRCARVAAMFTMRKDRGIHPDVPWDKMSENVQTVAHTTAQQIAAEIRHGRINLKEAKS